MAAKIRKGDKVIVLTGRDKGRTGEVVEVRPAAGRAIVRGVNMVKRHQRQTAQQEGGIISKEGTDPPVQPGAGRSEGRQADAGRASNSSARARRAARCASPSARESRSMADTDQTTKAKADAKAEKKSTAAKAKSAAAAAPKEKKPRVASDYKPRLRAQFEKRHPRAADQAVRLQEPHAGADDHQESCSTWASAKAWRTARRSTAPLPTCRMIAGQKAVITKSRKSIATYKLRDGQAIGCKVTLRKARMYDFLDRLVNIALPRVRDFRGLNPKSFDGRGNYSLGIKEHTDFPRDRLRQGGRSLGHGHHRVHDRAQRRTKRALC